MGGRGGVTSSPKSGPWCRNPAGRWQEAWNHRASIREGLVYGLSVPALTFALVAVPTLKSHELALDNCFRGFLCQPQEGHM